MNEQDEIRGLLKKIRTLIREDAISDRKIDLISDPKTGTSGAEKVQFDGLNTVGFLSIGEVSNSVNKDRLVNAIGEFIKSANLILASINIQVTDGRVFITSDTIKNPGVGNVRSISVDTNNENPSVNMSGDVDLNSEVIEFLQNIKVAYTEPQIGRENLVKSTQNDEGMV